MSVTINSTVRVSLVSGSGVTINAPVVPNFTTDDIFDVNNPSNTLTVSLANKQNLIGAGAITATDLDVNVLRGAAAAGVIPADFVKLHAVTAQANDLNQTSGASSNLQTQINTLAAGTVTGPGVNLTGLTVTASQLNTFFSSTINTTAVEINRIHGLTASSADLNITAGASSAGVAPSDLVKLHNVTASAVELSKLTGFVGLSTDLNKLSGMTTSQADLNSIAGLAGVGVSTTQLAFLSGLSTNVQSYIGGQPNLSGLTASASDLNVLTGMAGGTGAFSGAAVTATNLSYLAGATSNLQTQINTKMVAGGSIALSQITGASISITELNNASGTTGNIQSQLNTLTTTKLALTGGTLTGTLSIAAGSAAAPSLNFALSTGSGLYRASADTIGIAIAGAQYGQINASATQFGMATTGSPFLTTASPGVAAPTFAFVGDTNTGMYRVGSHSVGLAGNGISYLTVDGTANTVTIGGATATNATVVISGMFQGAKMVAQATINCQATGNTTIYTVPTGRRLMITSIHIVASNLSGAGTVPAVSFGFSGSFNQIVDAVANPNLFSSPVAINTTGQILPLGGGANSFQAIGGSSGAAYQFLTAGQVLTAKVVTATTGFTTYSVTAYVFGLEF